MKARKSFLRVLAWYRSSTISELLFSVGFAAGCQPLIGFNYGAKNINRTKEIIKSAMLIACLASAFACLPCSDCWAGGLIGLFTPLEDVIAWGSRIYGFRCLCSCGWDLRWLPQPRFWRLGKQRLRCWHIHRTPRLVFHSIAVCSQYMGGRSRTLCRTATFRFAHFMLEVLVCWLGLWKSRSRRWRFKIENQGSFFYKVKLFCIYIIPSLYSSAPSGVNCYTGGIVMDGNAELLNYIYQNSEMGVNTVEQMMEITQDETFRQHLEKQRERYQSIKRRSKKTVGKAWTRWKRTEEIFSDENPFLMNQHAQPWQIIPHPI